MMLLKMIFAEKMMLLKLMLRNDVSKDDVDEHGKKWVLMYGRINVRNYILGNHRQHYSLLNWFE